MRWTSITKAQGGLLTLRQLRGSGLSVGQARWLVASGRLEPTRAVGVYRAAGAPSTAESPAWFAVLSSGSPLSYLSAASWWEMPVPFDGLVHITRFDRRRLDWPAGARVHRVRLAPSAVTTWRGMPLTTRSETVLDCLGWLRFGDAAQLADRAIHQDWFAVADVQRRLEEQPGRWGNKQLRALLPHLGDGAAAESERRLHRLLRSAGITGWTPNLSVVMDGKRFEIDVAFPGLRLAIEVDGRRYHSSDHRFQADRTKQNALIGAGWRVLRFTWADIVDRPADVIGQIHALVAA